MQRLRVLAVANWDFASKPAPWAAQRVAALRHAGADVEVLGVDCVDNRLGFLRLWRALGRRLEEERFDLVAPLYGSGLGLLCALQRRVPTAVSFAGSDLNGNFTPEGRLVLASVPSIVASQVAAALAGGVSVRNPRMRQGLWWPPARWRAETIPSGVDTRRFRPMPRDEARRRRGLPPEGARVAFVALRAEERGVKRLGLARAAVERIEGCALDVIDGLPLDEMPAVYGAADALVLTSAREGSPNCVKEALACAVPVVSVDAGDVREVLAGLRNCAVVPPEPEAIAAALRAAIADGGGCPEGPARVAAHHSLDGMGERFLHFYRRVATDGAGPHEVIHREPA